MVHFRFSSDLKDVKKDSQKILDALCDLPVDKDTLFDIKLCAEEALINAKKHGNKQDAKLFVDVEIKASEDHAQIIVCDQGQGFDFSRSPDPTKDENLSKRGGRGVYLIKQLMDEVHFEKNGSRIRMIKKIKTSQ